MDALAPSSGPLPSPETSKPAGRSGYIRDWLVTLLIAMVVLLLLNLFVFNLSTVRGHSMQPTLMESQHLFVNKLVYNFHDPGRGDIVILNIPIPSCRAQDFSEKSHRYSRRCNPS